MINFCDVIDLKIIDYMQCLRMQHSLVKQRSLNQIPDTLLLAVHPPVITIGRSGSELNIMADDRELIKNKINCKDRKIENYLWFG